jgi:hypothetical protein
MWLSFKFQLSAAPIGYVVLAQKDLGTGKIHPSQATKALRRSRCIAVLFLLTSALDGDGWSTPLPCRFTTGKDMVPFE